MPGNYVVNPRSNGETIDAPKYLADHQVHVDNLEPAKMDDYSGSVAQMQASTDPGELSSESQPVSLAGELERIRFAIREAKGMPQWYQTPPTDLASLFQSASPLTLTNKTGATLSAGDVVGLSEVDTVSVKLIDTVSSLWPAVVARESIANTVTGTFGQLGAMPVLVTGAVVLGRYLRKSATTKALEDTGVVFSHTQIPPLGSVAVSLAATAGPGTATVVAYFFGAVERIGLTPTFTTLSLGTTPAVSGILRLPNSQGIAARNISNTGDVQMIAVDNNNFVTLGQDASTRIVPLGSIRCDVVNRGLVLPSTYAT